MSVSEVELFRVRLRARRPFRTARGTEHDRDLIIVRLVTSVGEGWGEVSALSTPTYLAETVATEWTALTEHLVPALLAAPSEGDDEGVVGHLEPLVGHGPARHALVTALLDARLRAVGRSWADEIGAATEVERGDVIPMGSPAETAEAVARALARGSRRLKLKVTPEILVETVAVVDGVDDGVRVHLDANGSFAPDDPGPLLALDGSRVDVVEQPFPAERLSAHAELRRRLDRVEVALDESIDTVARCEEVAAVGAGDLWVVKAPRLGGPDRALAVIERAREAGVGVAVGGMLESGVGRSALLVLAGHPLVTEVGDVSPATDHLVDDLVEPTGSDDGGRLAVPRGAGAVRAPDRDRLIAATVDRWTARR